MAAEQRPEQSPQGDGAGKQPLSPARRKRLQQMFDHANRQMMREEYDYAAELFAQCVAGDPGNYIYVQSFLENLKKKYHNNKRGSKLAVIQGARARGAAKKAASQKDWPGVIKAGVEALKLNPWDVSTLSQMADASHELGNYDVQLAYLKIAKDGDPRDPKVNKLCALALAELGQFDQAIACWRQVELARPNDPEPAQEISRLAVEKTIREGGYVDPDRRSEAFEKEAPAQPEGPREAEITPEQRLEQEIARRPNDISNYIELGELHLTRERFDKAADVFARALEASDGDEDIRERWEDSQIRQLRQQHAKAHKEAGQSGTEEAQQRAEKLLRELNAKELEFCQNRVKRYPTNLGFRYDLGVRYQGTRQYKEAIAEYQQARNDPRHRGLCILRSGQCFQQIKQFKLAMTHYESAIQEIPDRDSDNKKLALYLAGRLATALKQLDVGERHLTTLAGMDFNYRDVPQLLDKIAKMRENAEGGGQDDGDDRPR